MKERLRQGKISNISTLDGNEANEKLGPEQFSDGIGGVSDTDCSY